MTLSATINQLTGFWVFNVFNAQTGELLYIGCERLSTIPTLRELKRHALNNMPEQVTIELIQPVSSEVEGQETVDTLKLLDSPRYKPTPSTPRYPVQCVETGEVFKNAHQAAKAYNINYSYLYFHLQGNESYKTCKGLTFKYDRGE